MNEVMRIQRFGTTQTAAEALEQALRNEFTLFPASRHRGVMLAGGRTPLQVYNNIAAQPPAPGFTGYLILSDERYVPTSDAQANVKQLAPLIAALDLSQDRVICPPTDPPLPDATAAYGAQFDRLITQHVELSLGILGIGSDGHTASLFTVEQTDGGMPTDASWAQNTGMYQGTERISLSARALLSFQRLIFFVTGEEKREILAQLLTRPEDFPAGRIITAHGNAEIWTDVAPEGVGHEYIP